MLPHNFIRGTLNTLVLKLLADQGQMYGYQIIKHLKENSGDLISIKEAALYPALHKMVGQGLLETEVRKVSGRDRKYYRLSEKGKKVTVEQTGQLEHFVIALQGILKTN